MVTDSYSSTASHTTAPTAGHANVCTHVCTHADAHVHTHVYSPWRAWPCCRASLDISVLGGSDLNVARSNLAAVT